MPDLTNQIFAISSGTDRLSLEMSAVNLMGSHCINSVYLCERHDVLKRVLNSTCLGSLYVQDFQGATTLCEMEIMPQAETVLQLQDNWYLVYSPQSFTTYMTCMNTSSFICHGAHRIYVSPSGWLQLREHILISDLSICLDAVIKHYEWEIDQVAFSTKEKAQSAQWLAVLGNEKVGKSTLTSIRQCLVIECCSSLCL